MKISILVVYLAMIFGSISCKIHMDTTKIDLIGDDGNHNTNYFNVFLEKSLSRYKRANILSPVTKIGLIGTDLNNVIKTILNFTDFITGLLTGQESSCPEKLSIDSIARMTLHPIQMTKTILCHIFNMIGKENRAIIHKLLEIFWNFLRTIFLPTLRTVLNKIANTGILPPSLKNLVDIFDTLYNIFEVMGYVK